MFCGRCVNWIIHRKLKKFWRQLPKQKMVYKLFLLKASTPLVIVKGQSSQHIHKITNLWKSELNWWSKLQEINWRKKKPCRTSCVLSDALTLRPQLAEVSKSNILVRNYPFLKKVCYFRGSRFSQCFVYYQQLSIAHYQVSFYGNNYFE